MNHDGERKVSLFDHVGTRPAVGGFLPQLFAAYPGILLYKMEVPPDLKYIVPYIQRAQELAGREPIVSYYGLYSIAITRQSTVFPNAGVYIAQYYAATLAISRGPKNKETNAYLSQLLDQLEQVGYPCPTGITRVFNVS